MPGTEAALNLLRKKIDKMNQEELALMLKQLQQEKKRRGKRKKTTKK